MKTELNKTTKQSDITLLAETSYEQIFKIYKDNDFYAFNILKTVHIPTDLHEDLFSYVQVTGKQSWINLSYDTYGTVRLWWLICITNGILNPVYLPDPGTVLRIIKPRFVSDILSEIKNQIQ